MPITGRPSNRSAGKPWFFIQLRCMKPSLSGWPNQAVLRNGFLSLAAMATCSLGDGSGRRAYKNRSGNSKAVAEGRAGICGHTAGCGTMRQRRGKAAMADGESGAARISAEEFRELAWRACPTSASSAARSCAWRRAR